MARGACRFHLLASAPRDLDLRVQWAVLPCGPGPHFAAEDMVTASSAGNGGTLGGTGKPPRHSRVRSLDRKGVAPPVGPIKGSGEAPRLHRTALCEHNAAQITPRFQHSCLSQMQKETPGQGACHRITSGRSTRVWSRRGQHFPSGPRRGGAGGPAQGRGHVAHSPLRREPPLASQFSRHGTRLSSRLVHHHLGALWDHSGPGCR